MCDRLKLIANREKLKLTDDIYKKIILTSEGDARRAIMTLQNIKYINNNLNIDDMLGITNNSILEDIWKQIIKTNIKEILLITRSIKNKCINLNTEEKYCSWG